jgi:hypothetical protein
MVLTTLDSSTAHHDTSSVIATPSTATFSSAVFKRWAFVTGRQRRSRHGRQEASAEELAGWDASTGCPGGSRSGRASGCHREDRGVSSLARTSGHRAERRQAVAIPGARTRTDKRGNDHVCRVAGGSGSARGTLHAAHVAETHSGHNIYLYQPGLVVDTIRKVVGKVRHLS